MEDNVEFNEPKISTTDFAGKGGSSLEGKMVSFIRNLFGGLIKDERQARVVVVILTVLIFVICFWIISNFSSSVDSPLDVEFLSAE